jgi:ribosomal protein S18 acetylase RimI-like enzyme
VSAAIEPISRASAAGAVALLHDLRVSAFGIHSARLHRALIDDALGGRIAGRVAIDSGLVVGVVLAAPAPYWRSVCLRHWRLAIPCVRARFAQRRATNNDRHPAMISDRKMPVEAGPAPVEAGAARVAGAALVESEAAPVEPGEPPRSWAQPGHAWRIIFVGTSPAARRRGIAAGLYRALMADRSLVARVAPDNRESLRLHASLGWRLYRDGEVILAVYDCERQPTRLPRQSVAV